MTGSVRTRAFLVDLQVDEPLRIRFPGDIFANVRQLLAGVPNVTNHQWRNDMDTLNCLKSESGRFYLDESGIVQRFEPADGNLFDEFYDGLCSRHVDTLIVPCGVKGFCDQFMRSVHVRVKFELPQGLVEIGNDEDFLSGNDVGCVFANCTLPSVGIPESVQMIGRFAFGNSRIGTLQLPLILHRSYARQFKGSHISVLRLPNALRDLVHHESDRLRVHGTLPGAENYYPGWLYSLACNAYVDYLEFY